MAGGNGGSPRDGEDSTRRTEDSIRGGERSTRAADRPAPDRDPAPDADVGLWLVGARGTVGVSAIVGALALARGATDGTGLATARPPCNRLDLPDPGAIAVGGHEIRDDDLVELARALHADGGPGDDELIDRIEPELRAVDRRVRPGTVRGCGDAVRALADEDHVMENLGASGEESERGQVESERSDAGLDAIEAEDERSDDVAASAIVERLRADLARFRERNDLETVVVVNLASPEPPVRNPGAYQRREDVERAVETDDPALPASALYAYAAFREGCPYANCAQSVGASLPGFRELAVDAGVPHAGNDAKTGASLVESALAPLFAGRNLEVRAWEGQDALQSGSDTQSTGARSLPRGSRARSTSADADSSAGTGRSPATDPSAARRRASDDSQGRATVETLERDGDGGTGRDDGDSWTGRDDGTRGARDGGRDGPAGSRRTGPSEATERDRPAPETSDGALAGILEDLADSRARIDHARTVGNWTRSWDYVHLEGFLGAEMTVEFTWDGAEAPLAAPLVIDLARLLVHAERRGEAGVQRHLSAFFASPIGVEERALGAQLDALGEYVDRHAHSPRTPPRASD